MKLKHPFEPLPEDCEVVDSLLDVPLDDHDPAEDGDDSKVPETAPKPLARALDRLGVRRG